jgi:DNA-binding NtrC family response regulator
MVYGFAKQSEGHVLIEREPHVSTVVKLYFPRATEPVQIEAKPTSRSMITNLHVGRRILVGEDKLEILSVCVRACKLQGFEVVTATSGRDAMARISEGKPFDFLFSDIVLPGDMSGIDVKREAFLIQPTIKSILTTGYADLEGFGEHTFIKGAQILHKPYTREELLERIGAALAPS